MEIVLPVHIAGGAVALVAGFGAFAATKGNRLHRRAGVVFVCAMLAMGLTGAGIAVATGVEGSVIGGMLAAFLVVSGIMAVRPPTAFARRVVLGAAVVAVPLGVGCVSLGVVALGQGTWVRSGVPVPMIFVFGGVALLAAVGDLRRLRSGPLPGRKRITAHLWRMCFALFIASGSFFLGQADEIPEALRVWPALFILAFLPLVAIPYFLWKVRARRVLKPLYVQGSVPENA